SKHGAERKMRNERRYHEDYGSLGTQLSAASLFEYFVQPDRHHSLHFVSWERAVGGHHAHEAGTNKLGRGHQAGRSCCGAFFLDGAESVAIRTRELRYTRIL